MVVRLAVTQLNNFWILLVRNSRIMIRQRLGISRMILPIPSMIIVGGVTDNILIIVRIATRIMN